MSWKSACTVLLLAAPLACASNPEPRAPEPAPAVSRGPHTLRVENAFLWEASHPTDAASRVFLLGSVHLLDVPLSFGPRVAEIIDGAEEVVFEVDDAEAANPVALLQMLGYYGTFPPAQGLSDFLDPASLERLERFVEAAPTVATLVPDRERTRPWLIAFWMTISQMESMGIDVENGVENVLQRRIPEVTPRGYLETMAEQLASLAAVPDAVYADELARILELWDGGGGFESELKEMLASWKTRDAAEMAAMLDLSPDFSEHVIHRRNVTMAQGVAERLERGGTRLAVVGALHLVGDRSVITLLRERGYRVEPVR